MAKYAHKCNVNLRIIKAHYNIVKTGPSNVKFGNINVIDSHSFVNSTKVP